VQEPSNNWSCIHHDNQIIIHCEEPGFASQHFYPIPLLQRHMQPMSSRAMRPKISARVLPARTVRKGFVFPALPHVVVPDEEEEEEEEEEEDGDGSSTVVASSSSISSIAVSLNPNPFTYSRWYPESAHFVRQWWPTLPDVPRFSCTVLLLASHPADTNQMFVLAQHYFRVPLFGTDVEPGESEREDEDGGISAERITAEEAKKRKRRKREREKERERKLAVEAQLEPPEDAMRMWYVSDPFEVVCVLESASDGLLVETEAERQRPLLAVDFGHAVWVEYVKGGEREGEREKKELRFVTFPVIGSSGEGESGKGVVRTLEVPTELDLDWVETINIDQSQGAVILSVQEGKVYILRYE
jgi:hypothetical protein